MRLPRVVTPDTVTVKHPVMVSDQGNLRADWDQPPATTRVVPRCSWQPDAPAPDDIEHRDSQVLRGTLYIFDMSVVVQPVDRVTVPGEADDLDVEGIPQSFRDVPIPHHAVRLFRWVG